jgi:acyl-homoserine-lactone acylase
MKRFVLLLAVASLAWAPQARPETDTARWERQAEAVTIVRDTWGIPHVYGKSDADAVFGVIYAQAEDDFNRVETNYLNAMGRLAEAEGESAVIRDLRMKIFIDPAEMQAQYDKAPAWLKTLMVAYADGLNYYLRTHPDSRMPREPFRRPEDAAEQLNLAVAYHEQLFGHRPAGVWPSEGSVSDATVKVLADAGL